MTARELSPEMERCWWRSLMVAMYVTVAGCGTADSAALEAAQPVLTLTEASSVTAEPGDLRSIPTEPVVGRTGPGSEPFEIALRAAGDAAHLTRVIGRKRFELGLRIGQPDLRQYPCASCHAGTGFTPDTDRVVDAHRNIQPTHPRETGAACANCHAPEDVSLLALGTEERVTLDHAYRLCARCHAPQVDDWAAGAHGKRLDGWQGRRVVMSCADCHNPHEPALEKRIPFNPPRIARTGGRE